MKVNQIINYQEIQDVIEIGSIKNEKELVEEYVISPTLEEELLDLLSVLDSQKHKSANIIGNYGTGKSHLLGFLSLVLSNSTLIEYVKNEKIREKLGSIKREFFIVKYELDAVQNRSLARTFFYRVRKQLRETYGIEIREMDPEKGDKNVKELVQEIVDDIKNKDPKKGLLVIFDEFSDFLRQKKREDMNFDIQVYRQLGECSNTLDFMFMVSMQQNIFQDPKYVDQSSEIGRAQQRYLPIYITNESVEEMISKRIVSKNANQKMELTKEFGKIAHYFSNLAVEESKYVNIYPIHPYVIEVFSKLPFYEKRGIIQFLSKEIRRVLDEEFPAFITYDKIYDDMEKVSTIKNNPEVRPICEAVDTLKSKIDLIDAKLRPTALKLVKALAILNLINASNKNGATAQELANTLFVIPTSKILNPVDDIERILENLRKVSDGQLISRSEDGVYYLDLQKTIDIDVIIENKVANMDDLKYVNERFAESFLLQELDILLEADKLSYFENSQKYVLDDSAHWNDRNSFRNGTLLIDIGYELDVKDNLDYAVTFLGYGIKETKVNHKRNIQISLAFSERFSHSIKRLAAIDEFIKTKAYVSIMQNKKRNEIDRELRPRLIEALQNAKITYQGKNCRLGEDLGVSADVSAEIFSQIKQRILNEEFTKEFSKYPKLRSKLSSENIRGTIESILRDISQKQQGIVQDLLTQSTNILLPLGLYKDNRLDTTESEYTKVILDKLEDGKNISIQEVLTEFSKKPFGLQGELTQLILAVLLRNGDIILSSKRGNLYSASDFYTLFSGGLRAFDDISYIKKEEDLNVSKVQTLFDAIGEDKSLLQTQRDRPEAYRKYIEKVERIQKDIKEIGEDFERLKQSIDIGIPIEALNEKVQEIEKVDFSKLRIKSIVEFKKLDYSPDRINQIKQGYDTIQKLKSFFNDYFTYIQSDISYMKNVNECIKSDFFKSNESEQLLKIYDDSKLIVSSIKKMLKNDEREPLKGKGKLFKEKWQQIYYDTHEKYVGKKVDWRTLEDIENSETVKRLKILQKINYNNDGSFTDGMLRIAQLRDLKCLVFNVDELKTLTICPHCQFPNLNEDSLRNINSQIEALNQGFEKILQMWESRIVEEIIQNQNNFSNLEHDEKRIIQRIISQGYLDKEINDKTVEAINNLLRHLEIKEVDLVDLYKKLTEETDILKVDNFKESIDSFIEGILKADNKENVRLKIKRITK